MAIRHILADIEEAGLDPTKPHTVHRTRLKRPDQSEVKVVEIDSNPAQEPDAPEEVRNIAREPSASDREERMLAKDLDRTTSPASIVSEPAKKKPKKKTVES